MLKGGAEVPSASKARVLGATFAGLAPLAVGVLNSPSSTLNNTMTVLPGSAKMVKLCEIEVLFEVLPEVLPNCLVHVLFQNLATQSDIPSERLKGSASQLRWSNLLQPQLDFLEPFPEDVVLECWKFLHKCVVSRCIPYIHRISHS